MMRAVEVQPLDRLLSADNKRLCEPDHRAKPIAAAAAITSKTLVHPDEETSFSERRRSDGPGRVFRKSGIRIERA